MYWLRWVALLSVANGQGDDKLPSLADLLERRPNPPAELERLNYSAVRDTTYRAPVHSTIEEPRQVAPTSGATAQELCQEVLKTSPTLQYGNHFGEWLRDSSYQVTIAFGALLCGGLCSWDGPKLWENIVIAGISLGTAWLVHFEAEHWNLAPNLIGQLLLMLAAGGTAALAAHSGFEGSQVLIGAVLGFLGAVYCGIASWAQSADGALPGFALSWYCAGSAFGVWVFTSWRKPLLATLAPLFGSYLVVTGIGSLLSHSLDLPVLPQHGAPWSLGALVLLGPLGLSALPWYGACALLAASLHGCKRPTIAVMVLVAYIVLVALGALVAGMECHRDGKRSDGSDCPKMLAVPGQWKWQLLGCSAWAVLAAWCGYRQLSALKQKTSRYMPVEEAVEAPEEADPFVTRVPPQAYAPQGYAPQTYAPYQAGGLYKYVKSRH